MAYHVKTKNEQNVKQANRDLLLPLVKWVGKKAELGFGYNPKIEGSLTEMTFQGLPDTPENKEKGWYPIFNLVDLNYFLKVKKGEFIAKVDTGQLMSDKGYNNAASYRDAAIKFIENPDGYEVVFDEDEGDYILVPVPKGKAETPAEKKARIKAEKEAAANGA